MTARGLRSILDQDAWLREFFAMPGFWPLLLERATALDLQWPLHLLLPHLLRKALQGLHTQENP